MTDSVVSKGSAGETFDNDAVVSEGSDGATFGNDAAPVNDIAMFVRVRRRTLKGGHPEWREYRERTGSIVKASASYDVVRAVRVNGKPRHKFVCGLGSIKQNGNPRDHERFWTSALCRMIRAGLSPASRSKIIKLAIAKGAPTLSVSVINKELEHYTTYPTPFQMPQQVRRELAEFFTQWGSR